MDESAYSTLLKYVENTEYTENLTESEKRKLRKQAKHYVSKDNLLYYVSAKGETRRVVRETEKHRILRTSHSIVPLVNISSMPYLESEQQDETRNVAECDSEKAAVTEYIAAYFIH